MRNLTYTILIIGLALSLFAGSLWLSFETRNYLLNQSMYGLLISGRRIFVTLERGHVKHSPISNHYFFTYKGKVQKEFFEDTEEVSSHYFHSHSEGKNVEAVIYQDHTGLIHSHLRGNISTYYNDFRFLVRISESLFYSGLMFTFLGAALMIYRFR